MKKIFFVIIFTTSFLVLPAHAGERYPLPKDMPTDMGSVVIGKFYEINSVQIFDLNTDSVKVRFILAIYADTIATKELGFGQAEITISGSNKTAFQSIVFPLLNAELNKE